MQTVIIGDIHGCLEELHLLLEKACFDFEKDLLISVGDVVDRGPHNIDTLRFLDQIEAIVIKGNHDDKIERYLKGNPVKISNGMEKTVEELKQLDEKTRQYLMHYIGGFPYQYMTEKILVTHAQPIHQESVGCIYTKDSRNTNGSKRKFRGQEARYNWWKYYAPLKQTVFYGHYWFDDVLQINNTIGLDTSCVRGGKLSGYILEDKTIVQVDSKQFFEDDEHKSKSQADKEAWESDWKE